jgi:hypothetical protein
MSKVRFLNVIASGNGSVVGVATTLRTQQSGVWIPVGAGDFSFLQNVQTPFSVRTGVDQSRAI